MREILFKAKRLDNGEWVEGCYVRDISRENTSLSKFAHKIKPLFPQAYEHPIDVNTICQYTGFTDKYKRKIFENDLISFLDVSQYDNGYAEYYCLGQVFWDEETASFEVTERLSCESYEALDGDCEIIGNIFDNPELIGGGE